MYKKQLMAILLVLGMAGGMASADDAAASTEARLQNLEKEISALKESQNAGKEGKPGHAITLAAGRESALKLGGMLQIQVDGGDKGDRRFNSDNTRFYLRRARLGATATFSENMEARVEAEFAGTLGEANAMRAQLTDGYIQWSPTDELYARAGQFKTPFGFEQLAADPRLYTIERSLGNDRLTLSRQIGAQIGGNVTDKRLNYALGAFNGTSVNSSSNDNSKFTLVGRLGAVPLATEKKEPRARASPWASTDICRTMIG
ncbi:MAG: OprO/OprP family phosphate-selective porin [Kiritimatiellae bacterium]|nr:OprO/OprP family phosphate-selective porin [Kiritimatiellia bacterium]